MDPTHEIIDPEELVESCLRPESFTLLKYGFSLLNDEWVVGPRVVDDHMMYFLASGAPMPAEIAGKEVLLEVPGFYWFQPNVPYAFWMKPGTELLCYYCRFRIDRDGHSLRLEKDWMHLPDSPIAKKNITEIDNEARVDGAADSLHWRILVSRLMHSFLFDRPMSEKSVEGFDLARRERILNYIRLNVRRMISPAELAKHVELHPVYFSQLFKKTWGMSSQAFIKRERMIEGRKMLISTSKSVNQIADALGFKDAYLFSRQFKEVFDCTPKAVRNLGDM